MYFGSASEQILSLQPKHIRVDLMKQRWEAQEDACSHVQWDLGGEQGGLTEDVFAQ